MELPERRVTDESGRRPAAEAPRPGDTMRLSGLAVLHERIARAFTGRRVLELGCGVGAWTQAYAGRAAQVTAVDGREELLALARAEKYPPGRVEFVRADYTALPDFGRRHDALFAAKRWSRIPAERLDAFLKQAVNAVAAGALVAFLDERGASAPSASELIARASRFGWGANVELLPSYWLLTWWAAH